MVSSGDTRDDEKEDQFMQNITSALCHFSSVTFYMIIKISALPVDHGMHLASIYTQSHSEMVSRSSSSQV